MDRTRSSERRGSAARRRVASLLFLALVVTSSIVAAGLASAASSYGAIAPGFSISGLGELPGGSVATPQARVPQPGVSMMPSATRPYYACPNGPCDLIIDPPPIRVSRGYAPAQGGPLYEGSGEGGGYAPKDLQEAYKIPATGGSTQTVALVDAFGYASAESDLAKYRARYGLEPCTKANGCFRKVNQKGEEANYPPGNAEWEGESALDVDMASAACPKCHILLVQANSAAFKDLGESVNTAAKLGATEISNSYGAPEEGATKAELEFEDKYFNHPGVVVTASSGDAGYNNHLPPSLAASASYPAVSPYVIAVGGTNLRKAANSRGWSEEVWSESGSGCSKLETKPAWQSDKACTHRMDNDVAAVAGTATPVSFYKAGWSLAGGTSVSAPLVAGIEAHASEYIRSLGARAFYQDPAALFDVTTGSNGTCTPPAENSYFCQAGSGYDGPTGLGTPDGVPLPLPPTVETTAASAVTGTTATLNATVNPNGGEVSACKFEYGTTEAYGSSAPCAPSPGSGTSPVAVSAPLTSLTPNTTYHFRISATNPGGTSPGSDVIFKTPPSPPTAVTEAATSITLSSAKLNGTVNPKGGAVSECKFEYGTTTSYGTSAPCTPPPGAGNVPVAVSASVSGLAANTIYHFRVSATNAGGSSTGLDMTFATSTPHYYVNGAKIKEGPAFTKTAIMWGTITLANVKGGVTGGFVTCRSADAGTLFSPAGGAAGEGQIQAFATFGCESEKVCPVGQSAAIVAEGLPWHTLLTEEVPGTIRQETTGVKLFIECLLSGKVEGGQMFVLGAGEKGLRPRTVEGTSALHPGVLEFGEGSGELEWEGSVGAVTRRAEGAVKMMGYNAQELIEFRTP